MQSVVAPAHDNKNTALRLLVPSAPFTLALPGPPPNLVFDKLPTGRCAISVGLGCELHASLFAAVTQFSLGDIFRAGIPANQPSSTRDRFFIQPPARLPPALPPPPLPLPSLSLFPCSAGCSTVHSLQRRLLSTARSTPQPWLNRKLSQMPPSSSIAADPKQHSAVMEVLLAHNDILRPTRLSRFALPYRPSHPPAPEPPCPPHLRRNIRCRIESRPLVPIHTRGACTK